MLRYISSSRKPALLARLGPFRAFFITGNNILVITIVVKRRKFLLRRSGIISP
jgi:hypothetical protein